MEQPLQLVNPTGSTPTFWLTSTLDKRFSFSLTNNSGSDLHDHVVTQPIPAATTVDSTSMKVVETTSLGTIDQAFDWRYASSFNHLPWLPAYISGSNLIFKTLGRWQSGETRYFNIYWKSAGGLTQPTIPHLDAIAPTWAAAPTAGTAGDLYTLNMGGATYTYTMQAGDTATTITTGLKSLINAGSVAAATGTSSLSITPKNARDITFTVTNIGSTNTANLVVTKPLYWTVGRVGPDTFGYTPSSFTFGMPYSTGSVVALAPMWGRSTTHGVRLMSYKVNGDATTYRASDGTISSFNVNGPTNSVAGNITFQTRASGVDWAASWSATHSQKVFVGRKSDNTGANTLNKYVDVARVSLIYTCQRAHTPINIANTTVVQSGYDIITLGSTNNNFSGNTTEAAGNQIANFYAPLSTGTITAFTSASDLSALPATGTIFGTHGNNNGAAILVNSCTLSGFGSQSPRVIWAPSSNPFAILQLVNLSNSVQIPAGATITVDFWIVSGWTLSATTVGDNLLPDEVVSIARQLAYSPDVIVGKVETYNSAELAKTVIKASDTAVNGIQWFQNNGVSITTVANNYAFAYQVKTGVASQPDDDDGSYGEAYKLHGLCLRYLRTHEASLIPLIENQVNFHIGIEQAAVTAYGTWWQGAAPYWYWNSATPSGSAFTSEGGVSGGDADPNFNGGVQGTISYTQGQVRRLTSIDQMHMVSHGLYAYLYLLRNETAITANTTLRTNALNLLSRMNTFEAAHFPSYSRFIDNLYAICSGGTPTHNNGITDSYVNTEASQVLDTPYWGSNFGLWEVSNNTGALIAPSSNVTLDYFFRAVFAPDSTNTGVTRFMKGMSMDMLTASLDLHDVFINSSLTANGVTGLSYLAGWSARAGATGNVTRYATPRTVSSNNGFSSDLHYLEVNSGGARDHMNGRSAQRLAVLCLMALLDPNTQVPVEMNGTTVLRSVSILTVIDNLVKALAVYGPEPTSQAQRFGVAGYLGVGSAFDPQRIDSAFTGYWLMALELYLLVQQRVAGTNLLPTYYKFSGA